MGEASTGDVATHGLDRDYSLAQTHAGLGLELELPDAVSLGLSEPRDLCVGEVDVGPDLTWDSRQESCFLALRKDEVTLPSVERASVLDDGVFPAPLDVCEHGFHAIADILVSLCRIE